MAIDQRDVSSTLRFMDDRALQQYAAIHKNDPYIFPLAFQESQNRQRLRMSQQGAQGMQPQPKVADQALAQMASQPLPEDVGIGALPAPNMTMAAEGGIMGYEGYDEGPSDFGQGPVMMMAEGGVTGYSGGGPIKVGPELMRFLKSMGVDLVEFAAMSEEAKAQLQLAAATFGKNLQLWRNAANWGRPPQKIGAKAPASPTSIAPSGTHSKMAMPNSQGRTRSMRLG